MQMYVTGRGRRGGPHKVNIFPDQDHSKLSSLRHVCWYNRKSAYLCEIADLSYHMSERHQIWHKGSRILNAVQVNFKGWVSYQFDL